MSASLGHLSAHLLEEGGGSGGGVQGSELLRGCSEDPVGKRKLELGVMVLRRRILLAVLVCNGSSSDDLDGLTATSVTARHVII